MYKKRMENQEGLSGYGDILPGFFATGGRNEKYRKKIGWQEIEKNIDWGEKREGKFGIAGEKIIWDNGNGREGRRKQR
jgi:hypothetical protein